MRGKDAPEAMLKLFFTFNYEKSKWKFSLNSLLHESNTRWDSKPAILFVLHTCESSISSLLFTHIHVCVWEYKVIKSVHTVIPSFDLSILSLMRSIYLYILPCSPYKCLLRSLILRVEPLPHLFIPIFSSNYFNSSFTKSLFVYWYYSFQTNYYINHRRFRSFTISPSHHPLMTRKVKGDNRRVFHACNEKNVV